MEKRILYFQDWGQWEVHDVGGRSSIPYVSFITKQSPRWVRHILKSQTKYNWYILLNSTPDLVDKILSYFSKDSVEGRKEIKSPKEIIVIGGGSGWHFTDRPFATYFGYTPIYQSLATYRLQSK